MCAQYLSRLEDHGFCVFLVSVARAQRPSAGSGRFRCTPERRK